MSTPDALSPASRSTAASPPQLAVKTVTATLGNLSYALKQIKKMEKAGALPADGKVTLLSSEQAKRIMEALENAPDKPNCSNYGYLEQTVVAGLEAAGLDGIAKGKIMKEAAKQFGKPKAYAVLGPMLYSPSNLAKKAVKDALKSSAPVEVGKGFYYYELLKTIQSGLEGVVQGYNDHDSRCSLYNGSIAIAQDGSKTIIAEITYAPAKNNLPFSPLPAQPPKPLSPKAIAPVKSEAVSPMPKPLPAPPPQQPIQPNKLPISLLPKVVQQPQQKSVIQKDAPQQPQGNIDVGVDLVRIKNSSIALKTILPGQIEPNAMILPGKLSQSTLGVNFHNIFPNQPNSSAGILVNPLQPKKFSVPLQIAGKGGSAGINIVPLKLKNSQVNIAGNYQGTDIALQVPLKKPMTTRFSVRTPIAVGPIPLAVGVDGQLNHLEKMRFKLELPLGALNKFTSKIGISLKSIPIASVKIKNCVKKIKKFFGKKKKKKKKVAESTPVYHKISLVKKPQLINPALILACKNILTEMIALEKSATALNTNINTLIDNTAELQKICYGLDRSLCTFKEESDLLRRQAAAIDGAALRNSAANLDNLSQILAEENNLLQQNSHSLVHALRGNYSAAMAAEALQLLHPRQN